MFVNDAGEKKHLDKQKLLSALQALI